MDSIDSESFENEPISIASLPKVEELEYNRLSAKYVVKRHFSTTISFLIFLMIPVLVYLYYPEVFSGYFPLVLLVIVLIFLWSYYSNYQWQKRSGYSLRTRDIVFKRGFLFEKITVVPFNRIQHVSTTRGILDKALGLTTLMIFTAGGSGSDISIPGLTPSLAASLKESLSLRIGDHV